MGVGSLPGMADGSSGSSRVSAGWIAGPVKGSAAAPGSARAALADPAAAAQRAADRVARVSAGLIELDQWLCDQIRAGLAQHPPGPPADRRSAGPGRAAPDAAGGLFETIAARMVDAQAPGIAARLRRLPAVLASGEGWHERLLEQYAQLRLLVRAHQRLAELPPPLAAVVRSHVGYPVAKAEVLAGPAVRGTWSVLDQVDTQDDQLTRRRVWLESDSGRPATVISFARNGFGSTTAGLDDSLIPGSSIQADLHFYPDGVRALVGDRIGEPGPLAGLHRLSIAEALHVYAAALAADPWTVVRPVLLGAVVPVRHGGRWLLREADGTGLPLAATVGTPWRVIACSGGEPVTVLADWSPEGLVPRSLIGRYELVAL